VTMRAIVEVVRLPLARPAFAPAVNTVSASARAAYPRSSSSGA
jgi:hypothetical protein